MKKKFLLFINLLALLFAWQVSHINQVAADDKIKVVTTFYPVYEFTKAVTGDSADVSMLIKAGTEPHDFEPSTKNVATISDADMFVYMDDSMETWVKKVQKSINSDDLTVVKSTGDMLLMAGTAEEEEQIKNETKATIRCIPLKNELEEGVSMITGKPSKQRVIFAKSY